MTENQTHDQDADPPTSDGIVGAVLAARGRTELKNSNPQLPKTQQTLKEDAAWARAQKS